MNAPTFGSLFAGVGGFDLGFERAGWACKWQVEWDKRCRSVLARHWPDVNRYGDVRDVSGNIRDSKHDDRERQHGGPAGSRVESASDVHPRHEGRARGRDLLKPVDLITYGFPCQDLSVAGARAGLDGKRSGLFFEATRIIREMREATDGRYPRVVIAENVPGLLSADNGNAMGRLLDELAHLGAVVIEWATLDAQHFGVPQRRRRVFVAAGFDSRGFGAEPLFPLAESCEGHRGTFGETRETAPRESSPSAHGSGEPLLTPVAKVVRSGARDANGDLPPEVWAEVSVAPTLNAFDNGGESRATVLAFTQNQRDEVRAVEVPGALAASPGMKQQTFMALDLGVRRLTPRETERLQGFPDDWTRYDADGKELSDSARYRMTGNAVAVPVAQWVARQLLNRVGVV